MRPRAPTRASATGRTPPDFPRPTVTGAAVTTFHERDLRAQLICPRYFPDPGLALAPPRHIGPECSAGPNASISEHFDRRTLADGLPGARLPALFVHGALDPLPLRASRDTAALIPGARVEVVAGGGHFPWLERPGELRTAVRELLAAR